MVDLENNQIRRVPSKSIKVRTEQFLLNYNVIEVVENHAFSDAEIARLSLKGNRELRIIESSAFVGLHSLRDLDLSETAISEMPTLGLKDLEVLRLQDTESLKMFPSIYNFERFVALIHNKYCGAEATGTPVHALRRRESDDFGRLVYSPDNLTHPRHAPDWGALDRGFHRPERFGHWTVFVHCYKLILFTPDNDFWYIVIPYI
ncbi:follicle-stimulating hormone receptor-like [Periplaneta americana]|uniref:follicle-stimulating hormone receptor-like n=1 Tax=Periplaneta americana TaxID=6978 RepID=UPI0037E8E7A3